MQKIMFNDKYGLTDLVLSGKKTQTRRIIKPQDERLDYLRGWNLDWGFAEFGRAGEEPLLRILPHYYVGEEVAVAQSYWNVMVSLDEYLREEFFNTLKKELCEDPIKMTGWTNKMFVKPDLMPHRIRIKQIRLERLQDISDDDCMREGIIEHIAEIMPNYPPYTQYCCGISEVYCDTPRQAFVSLIDNINGKGTWESNPYVWVYDFELVK
jgi:hypothetical protein